MERRSFIAAVGGLLAGFFGGKLPDKPRQAFHTTTIRIKGKPTLFYGKYRLTPCGQSWSGTIKPIGTLTYSFVRKDA